MPSHLSPSRRRAGLAATLVLASIAVLAAVATAGAAVPNFKGSSTDGKVVFFETEDQLVPGDTDTKRDVYERSFDADVGAFVTREVSLGPVGGNDAYAAQFEAADELGGRVLFSTEERLVEADTDRRPDIYLRDFATGETILVSQGEGACAPACGNGAFAATFADADAGAEVVLFETRERLAAADTDDAIDLYVRDLGDEQTRLVSAGAAACAPACGNGGLDVSRRGLSADGSHAFFISAESLVAEDSDSAADVYARDLDAGQTLLVSRGECATACGNSGAVPIFNGSSADGERVFFSSDEKLADADTDTATDIYARDLPAGPTRLISGGAANVTASFAAASADGAHVFFTSAEGLDGADADGANDVYEWNEGGGLTLVTPAACTGDCGASFDAVSADSAVVLFTTAERLSAEDTDTNDDIYQQQVGVGSPVLVSRGDSWNGAADARFNRAAADASRVVFTTSEGMLDEDGDGEDDIYQRDVGAATTSLITTSPSYCPLKKGNCGATFVGMSEEGRHVFFRTVERFTLDDGDNEADIYERFLGAGGGEEVTRLVSTGNAPDLDLGPDAPLLSTTDPESPGASTTPRLLGQAAPGSTVKIYTSPNCSGEPVAAGSASTLFSPGLKVTVGAASLTTFRATAEADGFVSACSAPLSYQQLTETGGGDGGIGGGGDPGPGAPDPGPGPGAGAGGGAGGGTAAGGPVTRGGVTFVTPRTRITFGPASKTRSRNPTFRFTDTTGQPDSRFECKLDRKPWRRCSSPLRLKRLGKGRHVLAVRAVNAVGTADPVGVRRAFKVVAR